MQYFHQIPVQVFLSSLLKPSDLQIGYILLHLLLQTADDSTALHM